MFIDLLGRFFLLHGSSQNQLVQNDNGIDEYQRHCTHCVVSLPFHLQPTVLEGQVPVLGHNVCDSRKGGLAFLERTSHYSSDTGDEVDNFGLDACVRT